MVKLRCGVYGEGSVFSAEIERDADVESLQEAIVKKKKDVNHRFNVDPATVTLYLAKKNGAWLKDDRHVKNFLQAGKSAGYEEMRPSWKLNKTEYFGDFQLGEEEIHILVELPVPDSHCVDFGQPDPRLVKYQEHRGWISKAQWYLPFVFVGLAVITWVYGENPLDEKGCLDSSGRSLVCGAILIDASIALILKYVLPSWKAHYDDLIDLVSEVVEKATKQTRGLRYFVLLNLNNKVRFKHHKDLRCMAMIDRQRKRGEASRSTKHANISPFLYSPYASGRVFGYAIVRSTCTQGRLVESTEHKSPKY